MCCGAVHLARLFLITLSLLLPVATACAGEDDFGHAARYPKLEAARRLPFSGSDAGALGAKMAAVGWPAAHHTAAFRDAYRPAYRIVARELLADVLVASK